MNEVEAKVRAVLADYECGGECEDLPEWGRCIVCRIKAAIEEAS